jgi:hypothetical protein
VNDSDRVAAILRQSLDQGKSVEIEGLGVFRKSATGEYAFVPETQPQIFVAYVHEDLQRARLLCESLRAAGCSPWLDKDRLLPGQIWPRSIEQAIENSDAFIACFSPRSISKRGQFQSELRYALDCAKRLPLDSVFLIPVRFEPCEVPRGIADRVQYVDLYPDWARGVTRTLRTIRKAARNHPVARLDHL